MKKIVLTALLSSVATAFLFSAGLPAVTKLENARVRVLEITAAPGSSRPRHIRETDQVIVFLDDCRYQRIDSQTGAKSVQTRKSGDVIFHHKGEDAPELINLGAQPYRTMVVELK